MADAARVAVAPLDVAPPGLTTVNVATGGPVSMQQVLDVIGELRGGPLSIATDPVRSGPSSGPTRRRTYSPEGPDRLARHSDLRRGLADLLAAEPTG